MALPTVAKDMDIISALDDEPNDVGGLTSAQLKAKFDEGGKALKTYLNDTLIPFLESASAAGSLGVSSIPGVSAANVQEALVALKNALDDASVGIIPDGSITTIKLADLMVTPAKLADMAVSTVKLANAAVTAAKIAAGAIETAKIANGAVTSDKIAAAAVGTEKLGQSAVDTNNIKNRAVTGDKLEDLTIGSAKLKDNCVLWRHLVNGQVTDQKCKFDVTGLHIGDIYFGTECYGSSFPPNPDEGQVFFKEV